MVVNNLNTIGIACPPVKADTPLVVDPNAVLTFAFTVQPFEPIAWGNTQVIECDSTVQHPQFSKSNLLKVVWELP